MGDHAPSMEAPGGDGGVLHELLSKAIFEGDDPALGAVVSLLGSRHYYELFGYLTAIPGAHTQTREDVLQDTLLEFMEAVRAGKLADVPDDILGYVKLHAASRLRHRVRAHKSPVLAREKPSLTEVGKVVPDPNVRDPISEIHSREHRRMLEGAISNLGPTERRVLEMRRVNLPYAEIAESLGKDEDAVRKMFKRSEDKILRQLALESPTAASRLRKKSMSSAAPPRPVPTKESVRQAIETFPPEVREVLVLLHRDGKSMDEVVASLGHERALARRNRGYQLLRAKFGVSFPEAFGEGRS